jgi:hypothetical protein
MATGGIPQGMEAPRQQAATRLPRSKVPAGHRFGRAPLAVLPVMLALWHVSHHRVSVAFAPKLVVLLASPSGLQLFTLPVTVFYRVTCQHVLIPLQR